MVAYPSFNPREELSATYQLYQEAAQPKGRWVAGTGEVELEVEVEVGRGDMRVGEVIRNCNVLEVLLAVPGQLPLGAARHKDGDRG